MNLQFTEKDQTFLRQLRIDPSEMAPEEVRARLVEAAKSADNLERLVVGQWEAAKSADTKVALDYLDPEKATIKQLDELTWRQKHLVFAALIVIYGSCLFPWAMLISKLMRILHGR